MDSRVQAGVMATGFLILCSLLSCQTSPNVVIHESESLTVVLQELPTGYPLLAPYHHPYKIPLKDVLSALESLNYTTASSMPFSSRQPSRVFTKRQAESLASELSKALSDVLSEQVVAFAIADEEKPDRRTKGFVFVAKDELHLIIEELRKPLYEGEQKTYQQPISRWELLPGDRQRHYATRVDGKGAITNWIIIPLL